MFNEAVLPCSESNICWVRGEASTEDQGYGISLAALACHIIPHGH